MPFEVECNAKGDFTINGISLTMEYHSKKIVTENGMSLETKCQSNTKCHPNLNFT